MRGAWGINARAASFQPFTEKAVPLDEENVLAGHHFNKKQKKRNHSFIPIEEYEISEAWLY